jgi:hypothetical protein
MLFPGVQDSKIPEDRSSVRWDARNNRGVYSRLISNGQVKVQKVVVLKYRQDIVNQGYFGNFST